jgi:muramoyltetrapeptide carboxypeptidase
MLSARFPGVTDRGIGRACPTELLVRPVGSPRPPCLPSTPSSRQGLNRRDGHIAPALRAACAERVSAGPRPRTPAWLQTTRKRGATASTSTWESAEVTDLPVTYPRKLRRGDTVRVVAPARSRAVVDEHDHSAIIEARFAELGLRLSYGEHILERDDFDSSSVAARVADLHAAFADTEVAAVLTIIGGFNSNELLPHLDWDLIAGNPKILCGYSDITALQNAALARAGLVTYSGPHWSTFGMRDHFEQTQQWFTAAVLGDQPIELRPSATWTDDAWFVDQDAREVLPNEGWWPLRPGTGTGRIVGGNLCTLNLLQGTDYMPLLDGVLLAVEDDASSDPATFARNLTSLLQLPDAAGVRGLIVGRFQRTSGMTRALLEQIIARQDHLAGLPVLANVDFGHTNPQATLPIGGQADLSTTETNSLVLREH